MVAEASSHRSMSRRRCRDWASLKRGILHDVFTRLPAADAGCFRAACRGWHAAAYELSEIFLSDDPLDAPAGRCMAFAFFKAGGDGDGRRILASCVPGVDAEWARFHVDATAAAASSMSSAPTGGRSRGTCMWDTQWCLVECGGDLLATVTTHYIVHRGATVGVARRRKPVPMIQQDVVKVEFAADDSAGVMPVKVSSTNENDTCITGTTPCSSRRAATHLRSRRSVAPTFGLWFFLPLRRFF
ncbi:hypothetical protein HU200_031170 [Digitaria exilis]|uniref:F-box domain-containing protein n=1 Tax=Digitaria exilis TaxID=1010633 RepID=A0A835EQD2_9POAL|nr:hypothetical protein HU200_031170 [Digitaria exilis]